MRVQMIDLKEIRPDFFFRFTDGQPSDELVASVKTSGVLMPVRVLRQKEGYQLVGGFRRFEAARAGGQKEVPALIDPPDIPLMDFFYQALLENRAQRPFNLLEKARALRVLFHHRLDETALFQRFLKLLELPFKTAILKEVTAVLDLEPAVQDYIARYDLSLKQVSGFFGLTPGEQAGFMALAETLQIRGVELLQIVQWVREIARRESMASGMEVLESPELKRLIEDEELPRNRKLSLLKKALNERRYPSLTRRNQRLETLKNKLRPPGAVTLAWDTNLEKPGVYMQCRLENRDQWDDALAWLNRPENQSGLIQMLESLE